MSTVSRLPGQRKGLWSYPGEHQVPQSQTGQGPAVHPPKIIGDLDDSHSQGFQLTAHLHCMVLAAHAFELVGSGFELKTRLMADALNKVVGDASALLLLPVKDEEYENVMRTAGNISDTKVLLTGYINIRDLLSFDKVVVSLKALDALKAHLG